MSTKLVTGEIIANFLVVISKFLSFSGGVPSQILWNRGLKYRWRVGGKRLALKRTWSKN